MRLLLLGPTAVGKTSISLELAKRLNAEIICSDSRQCYKFMNIGTATPTGEQRNGVPHFNLSLIDPAQKDSAANFYRRAVQWQQEIEKRNHPVFYVGGSTLHQRCIIQPLDEMPDANKEYIAALEHRISRQGIKPLYRKLQKIDPEYARQMDGMNPQRIVRALDVWKQTDRPFSSFHSNEPIAPPSDLLVVGLVRERQALYARINRRVELMFENGFLEEVQSILDRGYSLADPGLNTVGYKQAIRHLKGKLSADAMIEEIKTKTRRYAKRQLTYFRRWNFVHWLHLDKVGMEKIIQKIMEPLAQKPNKG